MLILLVMIQHLIFAEPHSLKAFFLLPILVCFTLFSHLLVDNFLKQMTVDSLARKQQQVGFITHEKLRILAFLHLDMFPSCS